MFERLECDWGRAALPGVSEAIRRCVERRHGPIDDASSERRSVADRGQNAAAAGCERQAQRASALMMLKRNFRRLIAGRRRGGAQLVLRGRDDGRVEVRLDDEGLQRQGNEGQNQRGDARTGTGALRQAKASAQGLHRKAML
ncbi:MAG: hypothetical protein JNM59_04890 [Hyphomonadaceae bacterium]|nr:hypothetical protein [Hyphomonadaceae bacterium]